MTTLINRMIKERYDFELWFAGPLIYIKVYTLTITKLQQEDLYRVQADGSESKDFLSEETIVETIEAILDTM